MSTITVLYGAAYDGKNREMFAKCLPKIQQHAGDTCLYLVRTEVRVRQLREQTLQQIPGWFQFPVRTFPDFVKALYQRSPSAKRLLSDLEQKILLEMLLVRLEKERGKEFYFKQFHEHPGIVGKLKDFLNGVRRDGTASPRELQVRMQQTSNQQRPFYPDLVQLFTLYCQELAQRDAIDESGIFLEIARRVNSHPIDVSFLISSPELLVLEGYYELTRLEQQIFSALCTQFAQTFVTLDLPENPYRLSDLRHLPRTFHIMQEFLEYLRQSGVSVREYAASFLGKTATSLSGEQTSKAAYFFSSGQEVPQIPGEHISIHAHQSRKQEVRDIAREIRRLRQTRQAAAFREIGVTFPIVETYQQLIREIFPLFDIPFTMFQGYALASSPIVVAIFNLLHIVLKDYSREATAHFFASPRISFKASGTISLARAELEPLPLDAETYPYLDSFAARLGIIRGKHQWIDTLSAYKSQLEEQVEEHPLPVVYSLIPAMLDFLEFLTQFETDEPAAPETWLTLLENSLTRLQILPNLIQEKERAVRDRDMIALQAVLRVLKTLRQQYASSLRQAQWANGEPVEPRWTFRKFVDILHIAVQGESYYLPDILEDSVFVMGRLDTRQVEFRYLFFGGLVEKDFPGQDAPNIFFSEQEAEALGLPTYKKTFEETAYLFYLNVMNPSEHLYLSYPLQEEEKDLLRSMYVERLEHALASQPQQIVSEDPTQPIQDLYTASDLTQWLGTRLFQEHTPLSPTAMTPMAIVREALRFLARQQGHEYAAHVISGLQAQAQRSSDRLSQFEGILASEWGRQRILSRYRRHAYSASEFDLYIRCPIRYFFLYLLRLEPLPVMAPDLQSPDIGMLLHRIVYRFYAAANGEASGTTDRSLLQAKTDTDQWMQDARQRIRAIAAEELAAYHFSGTFWETFTHSLLAGLSGDSQQQGLLAKFVDVEAQDTDKVVPWYLEAHFGMKSASKVSPDSDRIPEPCGYTLSESPYTLNVQDAEWRKRAIRLRGKIDRIDLEFPPSDHQAERPTRVVLYDYKTGRLPPMTKVKDGRFLQLPLYILAAQALLGEAYDVIAGGYYHLSSPQNIGKKQLLGCKKDAEQQYFKTTRTLFATAEEFRAWLTNCANLAFDIAHVIQQGCFHPTMLGETEAGCRYCEYQQICRVDHQRMKTFQASAPFFCQQSLDTMPANHNDR